MHPERDPFVQDAENVLYAMNLGVTKEAPLFDIITWCI